MTKTACGQKLPVEHPLNHNTTKKHKKVLTMLLCLPRPYAATAFIPATTKSTPTKLAGNLTYIPIDISIEAICGILDIFYKKGLSLHNSKYIDNDSSLPAGASHALEARMVMAQHCSKMWDGMPDIQIVSWLGEYLNRRDKTMIIKIQQAAMFAQS
jgi:hypothetical protein